MSETPPDVADEARRWLGEAHEELTVAEVLAGNEQLPARAACFHAHLAAEKALKALLLTRNVTLKRSHDLALLAGLLNVDDAALFDVGDLADLNPWTIEGRYPADLADSASADVKDLVAAPAESSPLLQLSSLRGSPGLLVGDRDWPATTPFTDVASYLSTAVVTLRTLKSDVITGLDSTTVGRLDATGQPWRIDGRHALLQAGRIGRGGRCVRGRQGRAAPRGAGRRRCARPAPTRLA